SGSSRRALRVRRCSRGMNYSHDTEMDRDWAADQMRRKKNLVSGLPDMPVRRATAALPQVAVAAVGLTSPPGEATLGSALSALAINAGNPEHVQRICQGLLALLYDKECLALHQEFAELKGVEAVLAILRREGALRWCRDLMFNREVLVSFHGEVPVKFTLHQALVQAVEPQIVLHIPDDSHIFKVGIDTCSFGKGVIELCAGTGSMGIGPVFLGAHVVASLDKTPLAAHHLELNHHGHVMCADLCDPNNIWQLHQLIKDEQAVLMECVCGASSDLEVRSAIRWICDFLEWQCKEVTLDLADQWPMRPMKKPWGFRFRQNASHWNTSCQVDHRRVLPHEQILGRDGAICIERTYKKRRVEPPVEKLVLAIVHEGELHLCFHQAGDFAFVALRELGFNTINWLLTVDGAIIAADTRLWHCGRFFTIGSGSFPIVQSLPGLMAGWGNVAGGALGDSGGLSGHCVFMEASRLLRQCEGAGDFVLLSPFYLDADFLMGQFSREMQDALGSFNGMAVFFLAVEGHWVLVVAQPTASCWRWWLFDGLHFNCREFVDDLIRSFMASWGGGQVPHQLHLVQRYAQMDQTSCGTIALAHLAFCLQVTNELTPEDILHWHFTLLAGDFGGQPRATGPHGRDLPAMLADILITKGVHPESALHRARDAIDTLGGKNVQSALAAKNPWQALKAEATKPGKNFKFITPGELDAHIEAQAKSRYGVDPRSKKQKQRTSSTVAKTPLKIDPRQIKLIQGHFRDPEGHPLDQLAIDQVGADSAGVAICSSLEAAPYIAEGKHISTSPLGLLVLDDLHQAELGYAEAQTIRFAGQYIATGEPVLLNARLIQLGDSAVVRAIGKDPMAGVGVAPTAVIKVSVYKDEFGSSWSVFCEAPIRGILQLVPPLNLCKKVGCGTTCRSFHPPVDEDTTSLVHEVWGRRFSLLTGSSCEAAKSENFHAFLRVTKSAMPELVSVNVMGIYLEPRADSSKGASEDFAVIWLPEASLEDAQHKLRTTAGALSIARLKTRYGLRVPAAKEKDIHNVLKPGTEYVKVAVQFVYRAHPLPFGIQRVAVQRMIKEWQWDARALQPAKATSLGCAWDIGAACAPPSNVMTAFGQDVLLTCVRDKQAMYEIGQVHDTTPPPGLWATYQDSNEQRFQKLKAGMKELQVHGQQMQSWLHEAGERLGGTEQRLQGLTQAMESQQQDIQMVRSELRSSVESVNSNMQGAVNCMRRDIGADLDGKLESIA
ncbi:unnamed protein product, partial [Effrenium voratum]